MLIKINSKNMLKKLAVRKRLKILLNTAHCSLLTAHSSEGVSSMVVLILVVLIIIIGWELSAFSKQFIEDGQGNSAPAVAPLNGTNCIGSNTKYDCYDQDEGTDLLGPRD
jgi:hypothetical protein